MTSTPCMSQITIAALPAGQLSIFPDVSNVRLVLPQSTLLGIIDFLTAIKVNELCDSAFSALHLSMICIGGRPRTQTLEVAHGVQLTIEKGLDHFSRGCVMQADIVQYFDNLPILLIIQLLRDAGLDAK